MWSPAHWLLVLAMWWVMMIAMMTPSAAPMILLYGRATRHAQAGGRLEHGVVPTAAFAARLPPDMARVSRLPPRCSMWALERVGLCLRQHGLALAPGCRRQS